MIVKVKSFATAKIAKFSTYFNKKWLNWLNLFLLIIVFLSLLLLLFKSIFYSSKLDLAPVVNKESPLPKFAFAQSRAKCDLIDGPFLKLESSVPELQVPNLRQSLQFKGKSGRPDSRSENSKLHFSFQGHSEVIALDSGEKTYINFFKNGKQGSYNFSSYNMPTNLWFIPSLKENGQVEIAVHMLDDDGLNRAVRKIFVLNVEQKVILEFELGMSSQLQLYPCE